MQTLCKILLMIKKDKHIAKALGIKKSYCSLILSNHRCISWPLAETLHNLFPGKTIQAWKYATGDDVKKAFHGFNHEETQNQNKTKSNEVI